MQKAAIYKYKLEWAQEQSVSLDDGDFEFLCLAIQNEKPTIWVRHENREALKNERIIVMMTTGEFDHPPYLNLGKYLGTLFKDSMVWHFFFKH
jgi:hypothetical protein